MSKKKTKEATITPIARAYINMVQDSIKRMESSDGKFSDNKKNYIETLRVNITLAPKWFAGIDSSSKLVQINSKEKK